MTVRLLAAAILSIIAFILYAVTVPNAATPTPSESPAKTTTNSEHAVVTQVLDGDTVVINNGTKVRYIGIDAPELQKGEKAGECFASESTTRNAKLVLGKQVRLKPDVSDTDQYGRLLRYVYVGDEDTSVNEVLVREGLAVARSYPPDIAEQSSLRTAEHDAQHNKRGLWAPEACK